MTKEEILASFEVLTAIAAYTNKHLPEDVNPVYKQALEKILDALKPIPFTY